MRSNNTAKTAKAYLASLGVDNEKFTVGDLKTLLADLPDTMPIKFNTFGIDGALTTSVAYTYRGTYAYKVGVDGVGSDDTDYADPATEVVIDISEYDER